MPIIERLRKFLRTSRLEPAPTPRQWFSNPENLIRLRDLVTDPVFITACNLLVAERRPNAATGMASNRVMALRYSFLAGYCEFVDDLHKLAIGPPEAAPPSLEEWAHISP